jgi:hypothetical protein
VYDAGSSPAERQQRKESPAGEREARSAVRLADARMRHAEMMRRRPNATEILVLRGTAMKSAACLAGIVTEMTKFHDETFLLSCTHLLSETFGFFIRLSAGICEYIDSKKIVKTIFTNCIFYP